MVRFDNTPGALLTSREGRVDGDEGVSVMNFLHAMRFATR